MADVVVTVPQRLWREWLEEGDLPGEDSGRMEYHFWIPSGQLPDMRPGDRVYVVAFGRVRGYAPLVGIEKRCRLAPYRSCLLRRAGAVAVTIPEPIRGFQGWRYRWWARGAEIAFPEWATAGVPGMERPAGQLALERI